MDLFNALLILFVSFVGSFNDTFNDNPAWCASVETQVASFNEAGADLFFHEDCSVEIID